MIYCLANIGRLKRWELRPEERVYHYSVRLNPKTTILNAGISVGYAISQLQGLDRKFVFTVYGGNGEVLYEHKN